MDEGGHAYIDTPYYQCNKNLQTSDSFLRNPTHFPTSPDSTAHNSTPLAFTPRRGIGQGESASSLLWDAVYDILLDWIDPNNKDLHPASFADICKPTYISTPASQSDRANYEPPVSNAYADDLATITTGTRAHDIQQQQADWISAFCAFTGLQLNMKKIVPVYIGPSTNSTPQYLTVHDHRWQPTRCPILTKPIHLTYLGLLLDHIIANDPTKALTQIRSQTYSMLEHLMDQPAPIIAKLDYIRFKILPIILHSAQCANWSLKQFRSLDTHFNKAYKTILILPVHFPTTLLYLPTDKGGIGLPRLSDRAQIMKWRAFHRSLAVGNQPARAITSFLSRLPTGQLQSQPITYIHLPSNWKPRLKLVARSLVEWLQESHLTVAKVTEFTAE